MLKAIAFTLLTFAAAASRAEDSNGPPKPQPPPPHDRPDGEHKPHGPPYRGPGGPGGPGGMSSMNGFEKLSEEERKRVRDAMDQAWQKPEMQAAKEKFMKASEEFRAALRVTLQGIDPEVVKLVEKVKPAVPWEMRSGPPSLRPEDPEFAKQAVARLGFELGAFGGPEKRDAMRRLHEHLVELPVVKEIILKLQAAPVGQRMEIFRALRETYRKEYDHQIDEYKKRHAPGEPKQDAPGPRP